MGNYADDKTEEYLEQLERKIHKEYARAYREATIRANEYFDTLEERYQKEYEAYQRGEYTDAQFKAWYKTQVERGEGYEKMRDDLAERMTSANMVASAYINDKTPTIYSLNANHTAYEIEKGYSGADFQLVNENTVKRLMEEQNHVTFRTVSVNPVRDYAWNQDQISKALLSGIMQGKSIDKITESFLAVQGRNETSARRNARTAVTSAQNAGRLDTIIKAQDMGIDVKKQWKAVGDARTRDSHAYLNGQIREADEPFDNGLMAPADPNGAPAEVYNCRCRIKYVIPKYKDVKSVENYREDKKEGESYEDWLKRKQAEKRGTYEAEEVFAIAEKTNPVESLASKGVQIVNDLGKESESLLSAISEIDKLTDEYTSTLVGVTFTKPKTLQNEGGFALMINHQTGVVVYSNTLRNQRLELHGIAEDKTHLATTVHEFAHSLSQNVGKKKTELTPEEQAFWKEINAVYRDYKKNVQVGDSEWVSSYAFKNGDEFMSECFTQYRLGDDPSEYAIKVGRIIDKYWKKRK